MAKETWRRRWQRKVAQALELPADVALDVTRVEVVGMLQVSVTNHQGLLQFTPEAVSVAVDHGSVTITGAELVIALIDVTTLIITGRVRGLAFAGEE